MNNLILISVFSMMGLGIFFAAVLAVADQRLKVEEDPKVVEIEKVLPGLNCGACGFASCAAFAKAVRAGKTEPRPCVVGGDEVARKIGEILGIEIATASKHVAVVRCGANASQRTKKALYDGVKTCKAANLIFGGEIECKWGCLGYGDCQRACPFGAIELVDGLPRTDLTKCTGCGKCIEECPRVIIELIPRLESIAVVACNSHYRGAYTKKICPVGCIACGICKKLSGGAFDVVDNLARVDMEKAKELREWDVLVNKCPTNTIRKL